MPVGARGFSSEAAALDAFCSRVAELDPDVLTGWNVVDFDLRVLTRIAERYGGVLELGRGAGSIRISRAWRWLNGVVSRSRTALPPVRPSWRLSMFSNPWIIGPTTRRL